MTTPNDPTGGFAASGGFMGSMRAQQEAESFTGNRLMGSNPLTSAVDKFERTVTNLEKSVASFGKNVQQIWNHPILGQSAANQRGFSRQQQSMPGVSRFPTMDNPFLQQAKAAGGTPVSPGGTLNAGGRGGGPGITPPRTFGSMYRGNGGYGALARPGTIGESVLDVGTALGRFGQGMLPTQIAMSNYVQRGTLGISGMPLSTSNAMLRYQAFGLNNRNLNLLATNPADAMAGSQLLGQLAGNPLYMRSQLGRALFGGTAAFGYTNPGIGFAQAARLSGTMYSGPMSLAMRTMGYPVTPLALGGGPAQMTGNVVQGMFQRWWGRMPSTQELAATMVPGRGRGYLNLAALGYQAQDIQAMQPMLQAYQQLFQGGPQGRLPRLNPQQADVLFQQAATQTGAQRRLAQYGINQTAQQQIQNLQAVKTGRAADIYNQFQAGISTATTALTGFNKILTTILNEFPGLKTGIGFGGGLLGAFSSLTGGANLGLGVLGGVGLARALPGLMGKGAAGAAGAGARAGLTGGAAAAGGGGISGLAAALGPLGAGLFVGGLMQAGGSKLSPKGTMAGDVSKNLGELYNVPGLSGLIGMLTGKSAHSNWLGNIASRLPNIFGGAQTPTSRQQGTPGGSNATGSGISGQASKAVKAAEQYLGTPYVWGGDSPGVGFDCCLTPDSLIQTTQGPVPIVNISPGNEVYTWENGDLGIHKVLARSAPKYQEVFRIKTRRRSLEASGNHPFHRLVTSRGHGCTRLEWVKLEDLRRGDYIVTLNRLPDIATVSEDPWLNDPDFLWLLGAMFGDGSLSKFRGRVELCLFGESREYARQILAKFTNNKIVSHPSAGIYVSDVKLHRVLARYGLSDYSCDRIIPAVIWTLPHKLIESFLEGYTEADGSVSTVHPGVLEYKAANEVLIKQVRNLHIILGHRVGQVSITERTKPIIIKGKVVKNAKPLFCFISNQNAPPTGYSYLKVRKEVRELFASGYFVPERILSIESLGEQDTYDIEVDGAHNFIAEGINVHNSGLIEWAYRQAGVKLPRTSQQQWSFLKKRSISLDKVQEGDIVFQSGSDGTADAPGHEALMISRSQLIEAPYTGANVRIRSYNKGEWQHAGRPTGGLSSSTNVTGGAPSASAGNKGLGIRPSANYGSSEELSNIVSALAGGIIGGSGNFPNGLNASSTTVSKAKKANGKSINLSGVTGSNEQIMKQIAAKFGWGSGAEWNALYQLEMHEAGFNNTAQNPTSTAYGMGQFLDSTWAAYGPKTSDPRKQSLYMMQYIRDRYGDPIKAWAQYYQHPGGAGWYATGTPSTNAGIAVVGERGPELIMTGAGNTILSHKQSLNLLKAATTRPTESPYSTIIKDMMMSSGQRAHKTSDGLKPGITLYFREKSIVINAGNSGSTQTDMANSAKQFVQNIMKQLASERIYDDIARGVKN